MKQLEPLFFGRVSRIVFGVATLYWAEQLRADDPTSLAAPLALLFLGLSFLVGGAMGNPGCEITALPNLFLPAQKQVHTP